MNFQGFVLVTKLDYHDEWKYARDDHNSRNWNRIPNIEAGKIACTLLKSDVDSILTSD